MEGVACSLLILAFLHFSGSGNYMHIWMDGWIGAGREHGYGLAGNRSGLGIFVLLLPFSFVLFVVAD